MSSLKHCPKTIRVELPWFCRGVSPNQRVHWAIRSRATKKLKQLSYFATLEALSGKFPPKVVERVNISLNFYPPDRRPRDEDNLVACMKSYLDGIAMGLKLNDRCFHIQSLHVGNPVKPARICVVLTFC